ncbi:MAG TPA: MFS transporter [Stellaceae bacterium]|nr:MFS transporter [Stellaceae bacterium]
MTSSSLAPVLRPRGLLATPAYLRLWFAGGVGNAMRWLELLVAGIFTYELTHSTFLVALVTVARSLPMLFAGALAGVVGEALNRKRILVAQLLVMAATSSALFLLALFGEVRVWHMIVAGAVNGLVWASELAVRRRMIGEVVMADQVTAAVAFDSLTNSVARVVGPLIGGAVFEGLGLGGAYLLATLLYLAASLAVLGLEFRQEPRRLRLRRIAADIAEGIIVARRTPAILAVVLVSIIMNSFAFSYSALIAPLGLDRYGVSPTLVGALAGAEPLGAIVSGIALSAGWIRLNGRRALLRGSLLFLAGVIAMALSPWYGLAFMLLVIGGLGTAAFSTMQTTLVLTEAPPATTSRVMGIVTMCIGTGPIGVLAIGLLAERIGAAPAILVMAGLGFAGLIWVWARLARAPV